MTSISPSTWNTLGLGVATSFAALGLVTFLVPYRTAEMFGFRAALQNHGSRVDVPGILSLVGARDLSIAAALFALGTSGRDREMGTAILSTMILSTVDIYVAWQRKQTKE